MKIDFAGKKAIVCGGSRGIGRAIALGFAACGGDVSICARDPKALEETRAEIAKLGRKAHAASADLAQGDAVRGYVREAVGGAGRRRFPGQQRLGLRRLGRRQGLDRQPHGRHAVDRARHAGGAAGPEDIQGSVVNISSIAAHHPAARQPPYGAIKAAVIHYTRDAGRDVRQDRIRVNCIAPGSIEFPAASGTAARRDNPTLYNSTLASIPVRPHGPCRGDRQRGAVPRLAAGLLGDRPDNRSGGRAGAVAGDGLTAFRHRVSEASRVASGPRSTCARPKSTEIVRTRAKTAAKPLLLPLIIESRNRVLAERVAAAMTRRQMHLVAYLKTGPTAHACRRLAPSRSRRSTTSSSPAATSTSPACWKRRSFDGCFFADLFGLYDIHEGSFDAYVRRGGQISFLDPTVVLPVMAAATRHLGLGATLSTSFHTAYHLARWLGLARRDEQGPGRLERRDLGHRPRGAATPACDELPPRELRYDRADEVLEACFALWNGWDDGRLRARQEGRHPRRPGRRCTTPTTRAAGSRRAARSRSRAARRAIRSSCRPAAPTAAASSPRAGPR